MISKLDADERLKCTFVSVRLSNLVKTIYMELNLIKEQVLGVAFSIVAAVSD